MLADHGLRHGVQTPEGIVGTLKQLDLAPADANLGLIYAAGLAIANNYANVHTVIKYLSQLDRVLSAARDCLVCAGAGWDALDGETADSIGKILSRLVEHMGRAVPDTGGHPEPLTVRYLPYDPIPVEHLLEDVAVLGLSPLACVSLQAQVWLCTRERDSEVAGTRLSALLPLFNAGAVADAKRNKPGFRELPDYARSPAFQKMVSVLQAYRETLGDRLLSRLDDSCSLSLRSFLKRYNMTPHNLRTIVVSQAYVDDFRQLPEIAEKMYHTALLTTLKGYIATHHLVQRQIVKATGGGSCHLPRLYIRRITTSRGRHCDILRDLRCLRRLPPELFRHMDQKPRADGDRPAHTSVGRHK